MKAMRPEQYVSATQWYPNYKKVIFDWFKCGKSYMDNWQTSNSIESSYTM